MKVLTVDKTCTTNDEVSFWEVRVVIEAETEADESMVYSDVAEYHKVMAQVTRAGAVTTTEMVNVPNDTCFTAALTSGTYEFHEYFVNCPSVRAILEELEGIRDGVITPLLRHTQGSHILSLLRALDKLWD